MAKQLISPRLSKDYLELSEQIKKAIKHGLEDGGIAAKIFIEPISGTKLMRVQVVSPQFAKLLHSERQDLVWRIVSEALKFEERHRISMILPLTPKELIGK